MRNIRLVILLLLLPFLSHAQWEIGIGIGIGLPITGYKSVVRPGWLLNAEGKYRFGNGNFAVGMKTQLVRLQKDGNPGDAFGNARMTLAPVLFTAEYGLPVKGKFQPYIAGGLGLSFYNLNYDLSGTEGKSVFNLSFCMMPQVGLKYAASDKFYPFVESSLVLLADGPPMGFPKGEKMTGYNAFTAGVSYLFR